MNSLKVDGGASANNFLMQAQADMIQVPVKRPVCVETTRYGSRISGRAGRRILEQSSGDHQQLGDRPGIYPSDFREERDKKAKGWKKAVKCAYGWAKEED